MFSETWHAICLRSPEEDLRMAPCKPARAGGWLVSIGIRAVNVCSIQAMMIQTLSLHRYGISSSGMAPTELPLCWQLCDDLQA